jgi:outer membrane protein assembly factor BamA
MRLGPVLTCVLAVAAFGATARAQAPSSGAEKQGWAVLPGAWLNTDQGFGMSASALYYFRLGKDARRPSEVGLITFFTTQGDTVVRVEPSLRLGNDLYRLDTELEIARRASVFYGIGNDAVLDDEEPYRRRRVVGRARLTRRIAGSLHAGLAAEAFWSSALESEMVGGMLTSGTVLGAGEGSSVGVGLVVQRDTRNRVYAPSRGSLIDGAVFLYDDALGGTYNFSSFHANARTYLELARDHVLALQVRGDFRGGQPPFDRLPVAGDASLLRGLQGNQFRDRHFLGGQAEYRSPMVWRLSAVLFMATGRVAHTLAELAEPAWKITGGGGVRFALKRADRVNVRMDVGFSRDGYEVYVQLREAF